MLDAAHARGLVHRDVKPSNVLLDSTEHVYLADFGLGRRLDDQAAERGVDRSIGTPAYLASELRLDPTTASITVQARLPASARVDSLTVGFGDVWLVSSSTATLYRIDPRLAAIDHVDLGPAAGRPHAVFGDVWVGLSKNGGDTVAVNPRTLLIEQDFGCCRRDDVNGGGVEAFGSAWGYDVAYGEVQRWDPPDLAHVTQVTDAPYYGGSCLTSIAAGAVPSG